MIKTNGIILIDKPKMYTSRDMVNIVSKVVRTKKVGHTGTLDPLATGLMVVLYGKYTKLVDTLTSLDKEYIGEIKLGLMTDTLDITGSVLKIEDVPILDIEKIREVFNSFIGEYEMEVPLYSAIKVNGKKLYEYARNKEDVVLPIKKVNIYNLEVLDYKDDLITFKAHVEKGTYIRSLIKDIVSRLDTIGVMSNLRRIKQGKFDIRDANTILDIKNNNFKILDIKEVLEVSDYILNDNEYLRVKNGNIISLDNKSTYLLMIYNKKELALYKKENEEYKPLIMY